MEQQQNLLTGSSQSQKLEAVFEKQSMPLINFLISLSFLFATPMIFQIFTDTQSIPIAGQVGMSIFQFQVILCILGMHGVETKSKWSLQGFYYSAPVFCLAYLFLAILAFVSIGNENQKKYYGTTTLVFLGFAGTFYIFLSLWNAVSFYLTRKYYKNFAWFKQMQEQGQIQNAKKSISEQPQGSNNDMGYQN